MATSSSASSDDADTARPTEPTSFEVLSEYQALSTDATAATGSTALTLEWNKPSRATWSRIWPLPVAGLAYLVHLGYRRYSPRRLPTLTPLRLAEVYGTVGCFMTVQTDQNHLQHTVARDRDLLTVELFARIFRREWHKHAEKNNWIELEHLKTDVGRKASYPSSGSLIDKLKWQHDHMWSNNIAWNAALAVIMGAVKPPPTIDFADLDILITHCANTSQCDTSGPLIDYAMPYLSSFCYIIPVGMLARWTRRRLLYLPVNGFQRLLFYGSAYLAAAQGHQHWAYLTTLQDKHSIAETLHTSFPELNPMVDDVMEAIKSMKPPLD